MSLNLKNPETEQLVRELVARTGDSVTGAVTESVRERLARLDAADAESAEQRLRQLEELSTDAAARCPLDAPLRIDRPRGPAVRRVGVAAVVVDSSALIAILRDEAGANRPRTILVGAGLRKISAGTVLEVCIVVDANRDPVLSGRLDDLVILADIELVPVSAEHVWIARQAYRNFGKGSGHAAGLDFGDCFAYALARQEREPLLFVGDDFTHTDIAAARCRTKAGAA